jgi:hypothetical protein
MVIGAICISVPAQNKDPLVDDRPVKITRTPKTNRKRPVHKATIVQAHVLKIECRLLKLSSDGSETETNPLSTFYTGDHLRLVVKANQDGYLYIIHQDNPTAPGQIIFPDSRLNNGRNDVKKLQEIVLPSRCPPSISPFDCAAVVRLPAGAELLPWFSPAIRSSICPTVTDMAAFPQWRWWLKQESGQTLVR